MAGLRKLCPFRFSGSVDEQYLGGLCLGPLCTMYDETEERCSMAPKPAPKPKTVRAKKTTEG